MIKKRNCFVIVLIIFSILKSNGQTYSNPILSGFYPDPSICRVGDDYYIVNSSFAYFPGLPIFHSKDLVSWNLLGYAMDRNEQLDLKAAGVSRGLFAPTIRFHEGVFYIMCTLIDKGGNFIITAKDPKGPWSNPVWIKEVKGIDPSLDFVDGKAYITYNSEPPNNTSLYDGHRTIRMYEFDIKNMKVSGEERLLINGGTDLSKKPIWIEAPHLFKKDGWYYLICAEGGTGYNHSEVMFRTRSLSEPFISFEKNPILTQRHLDPLRKNPVTTTGHADLVETPDGRWYAVFLGCRPYEGDYYNTGRETFMLPVQWKDGWPMILEGKEEVGYQYPVPFPQVTKKIQNDFDGNVFFRDDFKDYILHKRYAFLRNPGPGLYTIERGSLSLPLKASTISEKETPAFIGFRQHNLIGFAATSIDFIAASENEKAGLVIFQSENHYYFLCRSIQNGQPIVQLFKGAGHLEPTAKPTLLASQSLNGNGKLFLKIMANGSKYSFYYAVKKGKWILLKDNVDGKHLSTKDAGGFVGSLFAMYGTSGGKASKSVAKFDWFEYIGNDDFYK